MEACPPLFYHEGPGLRWGLPLPLPTKGGSEDEDSTTSDGPTLPTAGGDASHSTTTEVTVVAVAALDGLPPTAGGAPPSPLLLRRWPQWRQRTPLRS
jgi:hypothetical protein